MNSIENKNVIQENVDDDDFVVGNEEEIDDYSESDGVTVQNKYSVEEYVGAAEYVINLFITHAIVKDKQLFASASSAWTGYECVRPIVPANLDLAKTILGNPPMKAKVSLSLSSLYNEFIEMLTYVNSAYEIDEKAGSLKVTNGNSTAIYAAPFGTLDFSLNVNGYDRRKLRYTTQVSYNLFANVANCCPFSKNKPVPRPPIKVIWSCPTTAAERSAGKLPYLDREMTITTCYPEGFTVRHTDAKDIDAYIQSIMDSEDCYSIGLEVRIASKNMVPSITGINPGDEEYSPYCTVQEFIKWLNDPRKRYFFSSIDRKSDDCKLIQNNVTAYMGLMRGLRKNTLFDKNYAKESDSLLAKVGSTLVFNDTTIAKLGTFYNVSASDCRKLASDVQRECVGISYVGVTTGGPNTQAIAVTKHLGSEFPITYFDVNPCQLNSALKAPVEYLDITKPIIDTQKLRNTIVILDTFDSDTGSENFARNLNFANNCVLLGVFSVIFKYSLNYPIPTGPDGKQYALVGLGSMHNGEVFYGSRDVYGRFMSYGDSKYRMVVGNNLRGYKRAYFVARTFVAPSVLRNMKTQVQQSLPQEYGERINFEIGADVPSVGRAEFVIVGESDHILGTKFSKNEFEVHCFRLANKGKKFEESILLTKFREYLIRGKFDAAPIAVSLPLYNDPKLVISQVNLTNKKVLVSGKYMQKHVAPQDQDAWLEFVNSLRDNKVDPDEVQKLFKQSTTSVPVARKAVEESYEEDDDE